MSKAIDKINKVSDKITEFCGDLRFLLIHAIWWGTWIGFSVEPFPYGLLTLIVSLEAIVLSTFILISQNRQAERDRLLEEEDYATDNESLQILKEIKEILKDRS